MKTFTKNNPKILNAWASYDWANSVYNLTITAAIFPVFFEASTKAAYNSETITFFGIKFISSILYSYAIAFSFLLAAILSPLLSGLADYGGKKKLFMKIFTYTGSAACIALFFFDGYNVEFGVIMAIIASMGYSGAVVFYVSYLPEIATDDRMDGVSARGFSLGFLGSVIQLILSLVIIFQHENLGISQGIATRLSFLFVGIWWIGFAQIAFTYLPSNIHNKKPKGNLFAKGFQELNKVWKQLRFLPNAQKFLLAFFFYNMGAQSLLLLATIFGSKELGMSSDKLIATVLLLQLVGITGAYLFAFVSKKLGNKMALLSMLIAWIFISSIGYFVYTEMQFYLMASFFGLVMGGIHLSRSTYAKLIPENTEDNTSFFSFYDVTEKVATAIGPWSFGFIEWATGDMRRSLIALSIYFLIGIVFLAMVKIPRGMGSSN